jgi:hypothetical protein
MFALIILYASILGALNQIHHAIMWPRCLVARRFGIFILNQTWPLIFGS